MWCHWDTTENRFVFLFFCLFPIPICVRVHVLVESLVANFSLCPYWLNNDHEVIKMLQLCESVKCSEDLPHLQCLYFQVYSRDIVSILSSSGKTEMTATRLHKRPISFTEPIHSQAVAQL